MNKTPFVFMRGIYSEDQVDSYIECLRNLQGKTNKAIAYLRHYHTGLRCIPTLDKVAKECGITLIPGVELSSCTFPSEPPRHIDWHQLWDVSRWKQIAGYCLDLRSLLKIRDVALIFEPATNKFYDGEATQQVPIDWNLITECLQQVNQTSAAPLFDLPIIWGPIPSDPSFPNTCMEFINRVAKAFSSNGQNITSRARWICIYNRWFGHLRNMHESIVGKSKFIDRLACKVETSDINYPYNVSGVHKYLRGLHTNPPVLYVTFDEAIEFSRLI